MAGKGNVEYFYVSREADPDGFHQVHKRSCMQMPKKLKFVGVFNDARDAIANARRLYDKLSGCRDCGTELNMNVDRSMHYS